MKNEKEQIKAAKKISIYETIKTGFGDMGLQNENIGQVPLLSLRKHGTL